MSAKPRDWGRNSMSQCVVRLQLWSTSSKASCMAHQWSVLPGTRINWAHNWIVVFISSSPLLASLGYGLLGKCLCANGKLVEEHSRPCDLMVVSLCHWWETTVTYGWPVTQYVFPEQPRLFKTPKRCKTATRKRRAEWKQSTKGINILVDVHAVTQKLYLQEGLSRKCMWHYLKSQK